MASEASPLENELVAFVEGHPETFDSQDVVNLRHKIIAAFAVWEFTRQQGVGHLVSVILDKISDKFRDNSIFLCISPTPKCNLSIYFAKKVCKQKLI